MAVLALSLQSSSPASKTSQHHSKLAVFLKCEELDTSLHSSSVQLSKVHTHSVGLVLLALRVQI